MRLVTAAIAVGLVPGIGDHERSEVSPRAIRAALEATFQETAPPDARLEIVSVPSLVRGEKEVDVFVSWPEPMGRPGPRTLSVLGRVDDRVVSRGLAKVVIRVRRPVWIASEGLTRGETLDLRTLRREVREFDRDPGPLFRPDPGGRFLLLRDVPQGEALSVHDVRRIPGIEAGEEVARANFPGRPSCSNRA